MLFKEVTRRKGSTLPQKTPSRVNVALALFGFLGAFFGEAKANNDGTYQNQDAVRSSVVWNVFNSNTPNPPILSPEREKPFSFWPGTPQIAPKDLKPSPEVLRERLEASKTRPEFFEPIVLRVLTNRASAILNQLGNPALLDRMASNPRAKEDIKTRFNQLVLGRVKNARLSLTAEDLNWLDLEKLSDTLAVPSVEATLKVTDWNRMKKDKQKAAAMQEHLGLYSARVQHRIERFMKNQPRRTEIPLSLFLPDHLRSELGTFFAVRGRNCFATALSFADRHVISSKKINLVEETGHDKPMINNDEFNHALWLGYSELSEQEFLSGLKLGDVLVFYEKTEWPAYTAIKHAAVHVAGNIYVHKSSKSAVTPVEFVTWETLTSTWTRLTKQLGIRYYRKLPLPRRYQNQDIAIEKILWNQ